MSSHLKKEINKQAHDSFIALKKQINLMKTLIYIAIVALLLGSISSCSNKLCPAYGSYPKTGR